MNPRASNPGERVPSVASSSRWTNPITHTTYLALPWLLWIGFLGVIGIAWWTNPRGFDLLDSGCYYLEYCFPNDSADTHTSYRYFAAPLFRMLGENIVAFRWLSWVTVWGAAIVFAWGFRRHLLALSNQYGGGLSCLTTSAVFLHASSAMHTIKPAALTYNSLNLIGMYVALGAFLAGTACLMEPSANLRKGFALVAAGALAATVDFFIKPTTSFFLLVAFAGYCLVTPGFGWTLKKRLFGVAFAAAAAGALGLVIVVGGFGAFLKRFETVYSIANNASFMKPLIERIGREFCELYAFLAHDLRWAVPILAAGGLLVIILRKRPVIQGWIASLTGLAVIAAWGHAMVSAKLWRGSHQLYFEGVVARMYLSATILGLFAVIITRLAGRKGPAGHLNMRSLCLWLLLADLLIVTPFAGAVGSTTTVYLNGALFASCWIAVLVLALHELVVCWDTRAVWMLPILGVSGFSVAQLVHGQIVMPYMNPRPLWEQTVEVKMGMAESKILVDQPLAEFIQKTRSALLAHGFKSGDDIFCFFNVPGLVYAVGGRSPVIPWYFGRIYGNDPVEEFYMQKAGEERRLRAWIITQANATDFREHYQRGGFDFPDGYDRIASMINPTTGMEIGIWKRRTAAP